MAIKSIKGPKVVADNDLNDNLYDDSINDNSISSINDKLGIDTSIDIPIVNNNEPNKSNDEVDIAEIVPDVSEFDMGRFYRPFRETNIDLSPYSQYIRSKSQASSRVKESNGHITTDNKTYVIMPDDYYSGADGTVSESDYELLIKVIAGEGGNDVDDMLGVISTILNRYEDGIRGNSIREVLENGYFKFGESYKRYEPGGKFYDTEAGQEKLRNAQKVLDDAFCGVRNMDHDVYYYYGDGEHNYFSDNV